MNIERYHRIKIYCDKNQMFSRGDKVILGVSGGADSVFLVYLMRMLAEEWDLWLAMIHVNHGIRGAEADRDEQFCRELAERMEIPFSVYQGNVPELAKREHMSEEEAGRHFRYRCMEEARQQLGFDKIAVAHHQDDQAETVLFQMLRGSSLRGLGGMRPVRERIVRPLLSVRREEIEEELRQMGQSWCEDSTNQEEIYSRNQLRRRVLPYLEREVAPGAVAHLARMAGQLQEVFQYLEGETQKALEHLTKLSGGRLELDADGFCRLSPVLQRELAMYLFERTAGSRKDITSRHVEGFCDMAAGATGKRISLPYGMTAGKDYGVLWIEGLSETGLENGWESISENLIWDAQQDSLREYHWKDSVGNQCRVILKKMMLTEHSEEKSKEVPKNDCTKWFDYARIDSMLEFRHPQEGDYFQLDSAGKRKKLSRFLIDQKIPLEQRKRLWILAMGKHVLWIPELNRSSAGFYVNEDTEMVLCGTLWTDVQ